MNRRKFINIIIIVFVVVLVCTGAYYVSTQNEMSMRTCLDKFPKETPYTPGEIIIAFRKDVPLLRIKAILKEFNLELSELNEKSLEFDQSFALQTPEGKEKVLACKLNELPEVEYAEMNGVAGVATNMPIIIR